MTEEIAHAQLIQYIKDKISITAEHESLIKSRFHLQKLKRKEFFLREGGECYTQGFIVEGTFRVFYIDQKASEHVLYFGFKDWWVGDIASFHSQEATNMNIQAMEDSYLLSFTKDDLEWLFVEVPPLERLFRIMAQRTLAVLQKRFLLTISAFLGINSASSRHRTIGPTASNRVVFGDFTGVIESDEEVVV
jgi:CRP-like cAMP-binding protein